MKPKMLIIDDDLATLLALPDALGHRFPGVAIDVASSAQSALALIERVDYDVIICDIVMPGMDGIRLLQLVRRIRPRLVIVMATAGEDRADEAMSHGAFALVLKPFEVAQFAATISSALKRAADVRQGKLSALRQDSDSEAEDGY